jgi:hypothetical protein
MAGWGRADETSVQHRLVPIVGAAGLVGVSVFISVHYGQLGDYPIDAGPPLDALRHGHLGAFFASDALMGSFALLARAPFVALSSLGSASDLDVYRLGVVPCVLAAALLGLCLARTMGRMGQPVYARYAAAALFVVNPVVIKAVQFGHPEEILGAALCTGAMFAAIFRRSVMAAVLFGLALTTKQWAIVAAAPIVLAVVVCGLERARFAAISLAVAAAVTTPFLLADPGGLVGVQRQASRTGTASWQPASPYSVWYPFARSKQVQIRPVDGKTEVTVRPVPDWVAGIAKKVIVLLPLLLAVPLFLRRDRLGATDPVLFLALVFLLRSLFDPVDNPYYHLPALFALLTWECLSRRGIPILALFTFFVWDLQPMFKDLVGWQPYTAYAVAYLAWTIPILVWMTLRLYSPASLRRLRGKVSRFLPDGSRRETLSLAAGNL